MARKFKKLRGDIRALYDSQEAFAEAMGMSPATLSKKLNGKSEWSRPEMERAMCLINKPLEQTGLYFFSE